MISAVVIALAVILQATHPPPASAQSFAECQAWLCLPARYDTNGGEPTNACDAARQAVLRRLRLHMEPLPSWSSCAAQFGWDAANLAWSFPTQLSCPHGGTLVGDSCQGTDADGCSYTYTPRNHGNVWVHVDGPRIGSSMPYTLANAGTPTRDCPPDPGSGGGGTPPQVVGPPTAGGSVGGVGGGVGYCHTISCPHMQHTWGANPLEIHWTLRPAPPAPPQ